jgi:superfamily II DNA or RNA helicase
MIASLSFRPNDVPRASEMVLVGDPPHTLASDVLHWENISVLVLAELGIELREHKAAIVAIADVIDWLSLLPLDHENPLIEFWSVATKIGLDVLARGHVLPTSSESGVDIWHAGPLQASDWDRLHALAQAMPALCRALPADEAGTRVHAAQPLLRSYWNALADCLARTPAAVETSRSPLFASPEILPPGSLSTWLSANAPLDSGSVQLGFRLEPPAANIGFNLVPYLQSTKDHSLSIDASQVWDADEAVRSRLGDDVEPVLLRSLRHAGKVWPPITRIMEQARPDRLELSDKDVDEFLDSATELLRVNGYEVSWPKEFVTSNVHMRASVSSANPGSAREASFGLGSALELRWEVAIDGEGGPQSISDEELRQLAEAKRPLLRLRDQWVIVDQATLQRIKRRKAQKPKQIGAGEALAAAVSGALVVDGETVQVDVDVALSTMAQRLANYERETSLPEPEGLQATLRPYQRRGLAWLNEMCDLRLGGCLADDMGLGKTIQVIALHLHRHNRGVGGPMLVVCPTSLLGNWQREIAKFAPHIRVKRFHGVGRELGEVEPTDVALVTYGVARREKDTLSSVHWDLVVADEAQHAKNPMSQTAKALRSIPGNVRIALTGTPVENQLSELWSLLDWTTPGLLGSLETFRRNIATPIERFHDEEATASLSKVVRPFLLRRRKVDPDIAPELPQKTETDVFVPLSVEQASLYKAVTDEALDTIAKKSGIERRGLILKLLTSLKQICNHPAQFLKQAGPIVDRSGKLAAFDEIIDGLEGTGESMLVFSQYVTMGRLLEQHLEARGVSSLFLNGSTPSSQRDAMVEQFQAGEARVFLLSLKAGGTGLNLTRATHVVHYDRWWNPAVEDQATDRAYRIGQTQPVQVHRMICEGTLEERIAQMLVEKRNLSESVIGSGETWISELDDAELASLVTFEGSM